MRLNNPWGMLDVHVRQIEGGSRRSKQLFHLIGQILPNFDLSLSAQIYPSVYQKGHAIIIQKKW